MQDDAAGERLSSRLPETTEATQIHWPDRRRRLDLDADELAGALDYEIDFDLITVAEVADRCLAGVRFDDFEELRKHKAFEQ